uniref:Uncharacterized protein n=1 Tax=Romanomermis culicivorax TaxID=13658 RepID=A0A915HMD1_ROMCU
MVNAVSLLDGTGELLGSAPYSNKILPTSTYPPLAASINGVKPVYFYFSNQNSTTSFLPLEQAKDKAVSFVLSD